MLECEKETVRLAVSEFPFMDGAKPFYRSEEHKVVECLRERAGQVQLYSIVSTANEDWSSALKASKSLGP